LDTIYLVANEDFHHILDDFVTLRGPCDSCKMPFLHALSHLSVQGFINFRPFVEAINTSLSLAHSKFYSQALVLLAAIESFHSDHLCMKNLKSPCFVLMEIENVVNQNFLLT
jgi:hypothetical protein